MDVSGQWCRDSTTLKVHLIKHAVQSCLGRQGREGWAWQAGRYTEPEMNQNNCKYWNTKAISDTQSGSAKSEAVENNSTKQKTKNKKRTGNHSRTRVTRSGEGEGEGQGGAQGAVVAVVVYVQRAAFEGRARCTKSAEGAKINKALRLLGWWKSEQDTERERQRERSWSWERGIRNWKVANVNLIKSKTKATLNMPLKL